MPAFTFLCTHVLLKKKKKKKKKKGVTQLHTCMLPGLKRPVKWTIDLQYSKDLDQIGLEGIRSITYPKISSNGADP